MVFLIWMEIIFFITINNLYRKFIKDIDSKEIGNLERISIKSYFKEGSKFFKENWN